MKIEMSPFVDNTEYKIEKEGILITISIFSPEENEDSIESLRIRSRLTRIDARKMVKEIQEALGES